MNERILKLFTKACYHGDYEPENVPNTVVEKFAELIVTECIAQCEKVASEADNMAKSKFVTDAGRMLHEGMWGGAKNSGAQIKQHFYGDEE